MTTKTAIIILAAGSSSRMGRPKQLLPFKGVPLIQHIASAALASNLGSVLVVTGAAGEEVQTALKNHAVSPVYNKSWQEGMGSSIACGMKAVADYEPECEKVILCVCDQPFVDAHLFSRLFEKSKTTGKGIVACEYACTVGTPVLFRSSYFDRLSALTGDAGAKSIVKAHGTDLATIPFADGDWDLDTPADYATLLQINAEI